MGEHSILIEKVLKHEFNKEEGYCDTQRTPSCLQVMNTNSFISYQKNKNFKLFDELNCKGS